MKVIESSVELKKITRDCRDLAFVPTMGALHRGHASLIDLAQAHGETTLVSIFVNPTQFSEDEDFDRYPRTLDADLELLGAKGVDLVFTPASQQLYHPDHQTRIINDRLGGQLCGNSRPRHFSGVLTIVFKLLNLCQPRYLVLGKKDYQQLFLIRKMLEDFYFETEILAAETVRETNGLATSSRNSYLSPRQYQQASVIYRALQKARQSWAVTQTGHETILADCRAQIEDDLTIEYLELRTQTTLEPTTNFTDAVLLVAVQIGKLRLIDNIEFSG